MEGSLFCPHRRMASRRRLRKKPERDFNMKKEGFRSTLLPLAVIPIGGLLALGICYLLFLLINNFFEFRLFSTNPSGVPVFIIRRVYAVVLLVFYLALLCTKSPDLINAIILVGPLGFLTTTAILTYYEKPAWSAVVTVVITAISIFLLYIKKKPWFYYYAVAITVLVSVLLAWPRV